MSLFHNREFGDRISFHFFGSLKICMFFHSVFLLEKGDRVSCPQLKKEIFFGLDCI
jgi:hypothetical protein